VSALLEKKSENNADKITENSQGKLFQASLLESLLNILESGSESAELVDCAVRREVGGMKKLGVESSEGEETERRRKSVFMTNTRLALCNAVLPTLLLVLTPTPTLTPDPPKCKNERFSFLSVRFLFSAVGVVSEEKRPAFLALVLPPIANFLCSLLAGAHTVHTQTLSFFTFPPPLLLLLFPFFPPRPSSSPYETNNTHIKSNEIASNSSTNTQERMLLLLAATAHPNQLYCTVEHPSLI
jgi:hypothetical protein